MLPASLLAVRPGAPDDSAGAHAPLLGPAAEQLAPLRPEPWRVRVVRTGASVLASTASHGVLALFLVSAWSGMLRDVSAPEPIAVEVVHEIPGEAPKPKPPPAAPEPPPPPSPPPAAPPPPAQKPVMAEPPPEARAAAAQTEIAQTGNTATAEGTPTEPPAGRKGEPHAPAPPPPAPAVLTAAAGEDSVPAPAKAATPPAPSSGEDTPKQPSNAAAAKLAAALPSATASMPLNFRAALAGLGTADDPEYRGLVFGALQRAQKAVEGEAYAKGLTGRVGVSLVLTATGAIASLSIFISSGNPAADNLVLAMVRRAAPFPPPPPSAPHSFTPMILLGGG